MNQTLVQSFLYLGPVWRRGRGLRLQGMHQAQHADLDAALFAQPAMRLLVLGRDRQFRRMARLLFERRGAIVRTGPDTADAAELARRYDAEVVVLDVAGPVTSSLRAATSLAASIMPVGVVLVAERVGALPQSLPVIPKWGPFEDLFAAVEQAHVAARGAGRLDDAVL